MSQNFYMSLRTEDEIRPGIEDEVSETDAGTTFGELGLPCPWTMAMVWPKSATLVGAHAF